MCGRYTHRYTWKQLHRLMRLTSPEVQIPLRYNVAPTQTAPVVLGTDAGRELALYRWGLVPHWAKDPSIGNRAINARSETAATLPTFRSAFRSRRCLVPVSGFYEWQKLAGGKKQPWYFSPTSDDIWAFAGLWETWDGPDGEVRTYTILTGPANEAVAEVHERMPVIIDPQRWDAWLDPETPNPGALIEPYPAELTGAVRVRPRVNRPGNDDAGCIEPVESLPTEEKGLW